MQYQCIYCLVKKEEGLFNKEHVLPKSFGLYGACTWTLTKTVCAECNQLLGDTIERCFARESLEGLQRFNFGLKPIEDYQDDKHGNEHIITIPDRKFKGLRWKRIVDTNTNKLTLVPEKDNIGCRKVTGEYDFYSYDGIPSKEFFDSTYPLDTDRIIIFSHSVDHDIIIKKIKKEYGDNVQYIIHDDSSEINCLTQWELTLDLQRALAKIAFNYLAFTNKNIIFQQCFNPIRKFIFDGAEPYYQVIEIKKNPILQEEGNKAILAHIIACYSSHPSLNISLAIHNYIHYKICLTPTSSGLLIKPHYGHYFDPWNKKIGKIKVTNILQPRISCLILKPYPSGLLI